MNKRISSIAIAAGLMVAASAAQAADGEINFIGNVINTTCVVNPSSNVDFTVTLPTVPTSALASAGDTAGRTPFQLEVSACSSETKVSTFFEPGPTISSTGNLAVDAGGATNVELQLLNDAFGRIDLMGAVGAQNSQEVSLAGGAATLKYYVEYMATGASTEGAANSRVQYTMQYQ